MSFSTPSPSYKGMINTIPDAWKILKKHPHKRTTDINEESIDSFSKETEKNLQSIVDQLTAKKYSIQRMRPVELLQKGKRRQVLISAVSDRIVCRAILEVIEPSFGAYNSQRDFSREVPRPSGVKFKGVPLAALAVQQHIREGYHWVLEADIKKFFDNVPKDRILKLISKTIKDSDLMKLIQDIVNFKIAQDNEEDDLCPPKGIAQGSSLSPLFASIYLYAFDEQIKKHKDVRLVRYVDDFIILCKDKKTAEAMYVIAKKKLALMGLEVHKKDVADEKGNVKTRIIDAKRSAFDFLGLNFNYLDIDIARKKKEDFIKGIEEVLHRRGGLYRKIYTIEIRTRGFIRQYYHRHYSRAGRSLLALTREAQRRINEDYVNSLKAIFGKDFHSKLDAHKQQSLLTILGAEIDKLLRKSS